MWRRVFGRDRPPVLEPDAGYDLWSSTYDQEAEQNLMLAFDDDVFSRLLARVNVAGRRIVDVGCGTGRHWSRLLAGAPAGLVGYDVSAGMLARLRAKHPDAVVHRTTGHLLREMGDATCDVVISTLALGHIADGAAALAEWSRVLRPGGDVVVTDFHPAARARGACSFRHDGKTKTIALYRQPLASLIAAAGAAGLGLRAREERIVDTSVRDRFAAGGALSSYERLKGLPLVYGLHFEKTAR